MIDLSKYRVHDLTMTFDASIAGYSEEQARTVSRDGWNAKWLRIYSHAGTHMDAPKHFDVSEKTIDLFRPEETMGRSWVVPVQITAMQQQIMVKDIQPIISKFRAGDSILLHTNWSLHVGTDTYRDKLPRISQELANWCVDHRVRILGVEPPSVADVNNLEEVTIIHEILLGGDVIIVEGLHNLHLIESESVFLIVLPIKTLSGDGAPARVIAFEEI